MSLAKDLEIYKAADQLLALSLKLQVQVPRPYRLAVGQRITNERAAAEGIPEVDALAQFMELVAELDPLDATTSRPTTRRQQ